MRNLILSIFAVLIASIGFAATTTSSGGNIVRMNATGDSITKGRAIIKRVKVVPNEAGKYFELRETNTTGTVIWKGNSGATLGVAVAEPVNIVTGALPVVFVSDDTTASITLEF